MRVTDARLIRLGDSCQLEARVAPESAPADPFLLWYRFPVDLMAAVDAGLADPFVAALLTPAMALGERLRVDGAVSGPLMRSLPELQATYRDWNPGLSVVPVVPSGVVEPSRLLVRPGRVGLFFSLGVDSFYSLLKDHPGGDGAIDDLIFVRGFDIAVDDPKVDGLFAESARNAGRVADHSGKTLVVASTNLRQFTDRFVGWGRTCHGAAMAGVALALGGRFSEVRIASTYDRGHLLPWGSHPGLDPLWSNGRVALVHDGCEATRLEKTRLVSGHPIALETLRVCWENPGSAYNCGRCQKCLLTAVELRRCGALGRCRTFPRDLDPAGLS